jgi:hypothetical protein
VVLFVVSCLSLVLIHHPVCSLGLDQVWYACDGHQVDTETRLAGSLTFQTFIEPATSQYKDYGVSALVLDPQLPSRHAKATLFCMTRIYILRRNKQQHCFLFSIAALVFALASADFGYTFCSTPKMPRFMPRNSVGRFTQVSSLLVPYIRAPCINTTVLPC